MKLWDACSRSCCLIWMNLPACCGCCASMKTLPLKSPTKSTFSFSHVRVWWWSRSYDGAAGSGGQHPAGGSCSAGCLEAGHHHPRPARVCPLSECTFTSPIWDGEDDPLSSRTLFVYFTVAIEPNFFFLLQPKMSSENLMLKVKCNKTPQVRATKWPEFWLGASLASTVREDVQHHFSEPLKACWNYWNQTICYLWKLWWESASVTHWPSQTCPNSEICFL